MKLASIDIGSNTVLLLVAKVNTNKKIITILNRYEIPRISRGLRKNGNISTDAQERLINVLNKYDKVIVDNDCEKVLVNATNAFRIAANGPEIVSLIREEFGYDVKILSGHQEARMSYLGATYEKSSENNIVIDIGGGSTEIIIGRGSDIEFAESMGIGAVNLTEKHSTSLPLQPDEIINIADEITSNLNGLGIPDKIETMNSLKMTAVAGTPTTLSCIKQNLKEYVEDLIEGSELTIDDLDSISAELSMHKPSEVLDKYGEVVKGREDVLLTGTILLKTIARFFGTYNISVSGRGIRYGAVIDHLIHQN